MSQRLELLSSFALHGMMVHLEPASHVFLQLHTLQLLLALQRATKTKKTHRSTMKCTTKKQRYINGDYHAMESHTPLHTPSPLTRQTPPASHVFRPAPGGRRCRACSVRRSSCSCQSCFFSHTICGAVTIV